MSIRGSLGRLLILKGGLLVGVVLGYEGYSYLNKIEHNLVNKNQPVQENFFPYSPSLRIEDETNTNGKLETYLKTKNYDIDLKKVEIFEDLHPSTESQINNLEHRIEKKYDDAHLKTNEYFDLFKKSYNLQNENKIPDSINASNFVSYVHTKSQEDIVGSVNNAEDAYNNLITDTREYVDSLFAEMIRK